MLRHSELKKRVIFCSKILWNYRLLKGYIQLALPNNSSTELWLSTLLRRLNWVSHSNTSLLLLGDVESSIVHHCSLFAFAYSVDLGDHCRNSFKFLSELLGDRRNLPRIRKNYSSSCIIRFQLYVNLLY